MVIHPGSPDAERYLELLRHYTNDPKATIADVLNVVFCCRRHDELARILRQTEFSQLKLMRAETYAIQFSAESMGTGGP